ncbi:MAG: hypothetical protein JJU27_13965 [Gammaproteobacteria bacterium]|nr:hypothetical protein [Gammaproteobacteria bacterium]
MDDDEMRCLAWASGPLDEHLLEAAGHDLEVIEIHPMFGLCVVDLAGREVWCGIPQDWTRPGAWRIH